MRARRVDCLVTNDRGFGGRLRKRSQDHDRAVVDHDRGRLDRHRLDEALLRQPGATEHVVGPGQDRYQRSARPSIVRISVVLYGGGWNRSRRHLEREVMVCRH
jgi:hypothetical protein